MFETNPFSILAEIVPPIAMQSFIIAMVVLIALGTIIQMISHKNLTYFLNIPPFHGRKQNYIYSVGVHDHQYFPMFLTHSGLQF